MFRKFFKKSRLSVAKKAFLKEDVKLSQEAHTKEAIRDFIHQESHQKERGEYIGDFVYGALDGVVTTFAVVAGAAGASLNSGVVLIMGLANLFADGLSMAMGNYLSTKSQQQYEERERQRELWEIDNLPEAEKEEIREIFAKKGFEGALLEEIVTTISKNKKVWVDTMLAEELHIFLDKKSPVKSAAVTFTAFLVIGFFPLLPYTSEFFFNTSGQNNFFISVAITGLVLFIAGSMRSFVIAKMWWRAGLEMFLVGSVAAAVAYVVGMWLRELA